MSKTILEQYQDAKAAAPGVLLIFECGDFYELLHDDARIAAKILGLTLTTMHRETPIPMTGFPRHQLEGYMQKLIRAGHRVSVCNA